MKKSILIAITAVTAIVAVLTGCNSGPKKLIVGLSLPTQREARWVSDKATMEAAAKEAGIDLRVVVTDTNVAEQATQVEQLLSQGIQVLILAPVDGAAAAALADKAKEKKVPVIAYDRMVMNTASLDYYLSFDNEEVGRLQGKYITEKVPAGNYILMAGDPADNNATLFKKGAMEFIQPLIDSGKIKVIADQAVANWEPNNALKIVEAALTASANKIDAILAPNDGTAGGAVQALAAQKLDGKVVITGQDSEVGAAKRIKAGTQSMTIFKDTRALGKAAIEAAKLLAEGKPLTNATKTVSNTAKDVPSILLPPTVVDAANLEEVLIKSGYLKADDIK